MCVVVHVQGHLRKNWKRRLFVLTPTAIRYYESSPRSKPLDEIDMKSILEIRAPQTDTALFEIRTVRGKDFRLRARDYTEAMEWVRDIRAARVAPSPLVQLQLQVQQADAEGKISEEVRCGVL